MTSNEFFYKTDKLPPVFFLFLFYIVVWWLQLGERLGERFGTEIRLEAFVAVVLLVVTLFDSYRKTPEEKAGFSPFILAFFAVMVIQVVFAWSTDRAWYVFTEQVLKYSAMGLFISRFVRTPRQLAWLMFTWLLACWKGTLEGVLGGITGSLVWENQGIMRLNGVGLWAHPNSFSQFALGAIPFCFYLFPQVKKMWLKVGLVSLFVFATYVVIYTGSRTGYLGFIIMMVLFFLQSARKVRKRILLVMLIMIPATIFFMPKDYRERFISSFHGKEKEGASKDSRIKLYKEGWYVFTRHPFGVGVGNYPEAGMKYFGYKMEQHCLYTEILTDLGIQGFIIFMILMRKIYHILNTTRKNLLDMLNIHGLSNSFNGELVDSIRFTHAVVQSAMVYFLMRLFLDIFGMDLYGICWWFIIGIASSVHSIMTQLRLRTEVELKNPIIETKTC